MFSNICMEDDFVFHRPVYLWSIWSRIDSLSSKGNGAAHSSVTLVKMLNCDINKHRYISGKSECNNETQCFETLTWNVQLEQYSICVNLTDNRQQHTYYSQSCVFISSAYIYKWYLYNVLFLLVAVSSSYFPQYNTIVYKVFSFLRLNLYQRATVLFFFPLKFIAIYLWNCIIYLCKVLWDTSSCERFAVQFYSVHMELYLSQLF